MTPSENKRQHYPPEVEWFIRAHANQPASVIKRKLDEVGPLPKEQGGLGVARDDIPTHARTIQRRLNRLRVERETDGSEPWTLQSSDPDDLATLLEMQAALLIDDWPPLTERQADMVLRVRRAAPTLSSRHTHFLALDYLNRPEMRRDIEIYLALRPWESDDRHTRWLELEEAGTVKPFGMLNVLWRGAARTEMQRRARQSEGGV